MAGEATKGAGGWRAGKGRAAPPASPLRASAKKWSGAFLLALMLIAVVVATVWIAWILYVPSKANPYFVAFWVGDFQRRSGTDRAEVQISRLSSPIPPISWMKADRDALKDAKVFRRLETGEDQTWNPPRDVMETQLQALRSLKPSDSVVVYIASYATIGEGGKVHVLAYDSDPFQPKTLLPLSAVLSFLKDCPSRQKLLVLDIMRNTPDPFDLGGTAEGVAALVRKQLQSDSDPRKLADPDLLVIGACAPDQTALGSESLGHSVFGHFFRLGLTSPQADTDQDRVINVGELATFLERKVDQWAEHHLGAPQRPFLIGPVEKKGFPLATLTKQASISWTWPWKKPAAPAKSAPGDQPAEKTAEKAAEKTVEKVADKDKAKENEKGRESASETNGPSYPEWLTVGWTLRDQWWKAKDLLASPRAFLRLEAVLLRAEQRWRGGDDSATVQGELERESSAIQTEMSRAKVIPTPTPFRSVGQATALGWTHDAELAVSLQRFLAAPLNLIDAKQKSEFIEKQLKGKTSLAVAGAIIDTADNITFDPKMLAFLDSLITESRLPRDIVELRFLKQLSARLARDATDKRFDAIARQAWKVVLVSESAGSQAEAFSWIREQLTLADALRHTAEVLLLSEASGFVSPEQIRSSWDQAERAYRTVQSFEDRLRTAQVERGRALARLRFAIPLLEAIADPEYERAWLDTAEAARTLDQLLEKPEQPLPAEKLEDLNRRINDLLPELTRLSGLLARPFQDSALDEELARQAQPTVRPSPAFARRIEAILATPYPSAGQRPKLWLAGRKLDQRLAEIAPAESESEASSATDDDARRRDLVARRVKRMIALVALSGEASTARSLEGSLALVREAIALKKETGSDLRRDLADVGKLWSEVASFSHLVHAKFESLAGKSDLGDSRDRTGWVVPIFLLDWRRNPSREGRLRDARETWSWLTDHYLHEAHDCYEPDLDDTPTFYQRAAWDVWTCDPAAHGAGEVLPETYLEISTEPAALVLSRARTGGEVVVKLLLHSPDTERPQKVSLATISPDDPRLRLSLPKPAELELTPNISNIVTVRAQWVEDDLAPAPPTTPNGFIVQARLPNQRAYHRLVPTKIVAESLRPRLVLTGDPDPSRSEELSFDHLRLRPIPGRQPLYLFVRNPAPTPRDLLVELQAGGGSPPGPVKVKLKVAANSTTQVPNFAPPPGPKPNEPLNRLTGPIRLRLLEDRENGSVLDDRTAQISIATPDDYLTDFFEITQAQYVPANQPGEQNRLTVRLKALHRWSGPPCAVDLGFPTDTDKELFPALLEPPKVGKLSGALVFGEPLTLTAEEIALDPAAPEAGMFYLNIDGIKRALWFRTKFVRVGSPQKAFLDPKPRVRFRPEIKVEPPSATLGVRFVVDNAPGDAKLNFRLGRRDANGTFVEDIPSWTDTAEDRSLGFDPRGENGALLFEADIRQWVRVFNARGLRGERELEARVLDAKGRKELARYSMLLTLDDQPPVIVSLEVPTEAIKNTTLPASAKVVPPASRIKEALFFFGAPADAEKAKASGQSVQGRPTDESARTWEAKLPLPKDVLGKIAVTARFTSGVNLSEFISEEVTIIAPPPTPEEEAAAKPKKPVGPGAIAGVVVAEANLPQPGLDVHLYAVDPEAKEKYKFLQTQNTTPEGAYTFKDLKPGRYLIYSVKMSTNRKGVKEVTVEAEKTAKGDLELLQP